MKSSSVSATHTYPWTHDPSPALEFGDRIPRPPSAFCPTWAKPDIESEGVHVWRAPGFRHIDREQLGTRLSAAEIARAERFLNPGARIDFTASRLILRDIIARYTQGREICIIADEHGKPHLTRENIHFNISHSGDVAVFCIATGIPVGIDVELIDPELGCDEGVAAQVFTKNELSEWCRLNFDDRVKTFYCCWTRKEAYSKCTGLGLTTDLRMTEVGLWPDQARIGESSLWSFEPHPGYVAAVAYPGETCLPKFWDWEAC